MSTEEKVHVVDPGSIQHKISAGAFGMAFVNEAWLRKFPTHEEMEEYRKSGASLNDDEQAALREEGIILAYEHRALPAGEQTIGAWAKILRPGRGKPRLGPWATDHGLEGRFVGLLPGDEYLNRTALVLDELVKGAMSMGVGKEMAAEIIARGRWHRRGWPPPAWLAQRIREMEW